MVNCKSTSHGIDDDNKENDGKNKQKFTSTSSNHEDLTDEDDYNSYGFNGDVRNFVILAACFINFTMLKGSDFSSDSNFVV